MRSFQPMAMFHPWARLAVVAGGDCDANHARDLDADKHILGMFPEELGFGREAVVEKAQIDTDICHFYSFPCAVFGGEAVDLCPLSEFVGKRVISADVIFGDMVV